MIASHPAATMLMEYIAFIQVWYVDLKLHVYVSVNLREESGAYDPVRQLVSDLAGTLKSETVVYDPDMMGGQARYLVYNVANAMSVTEQGMRMVS